jgi:protein phosphatase
MTDERAVEAGQMSRQARVDLPQADTIGYFEPNQLTRLTNDGRLYVVADGVSGTASGQIAAQYAVKKVLHRFYTLTTPDPQARLLEVIQETNKDIFDHNLQQPEKRPMATALMAALIHNNTLFVANVGDSRVYVVWDQDIERLDARSETPASARAENTDEVQTQAKMPLPEPAEMAEEKPAKPEPPAASVPRLPQGLGLESQVEIEHYTRRLFAGDVALLCTGGLSGYVTEKEIARAITQHGPEQAIQRLLALAAQRGSQDHLALSATRVLSSPVIAPAATPKPAPPAPKWSDWDTTPKPPSPIPTPPLAQTSKLPAPADGQPQTGETPASLLDDEPQRRWPMVAGGALGLIVLCAMAWLVGRLLLPAELIASIPLFGEGETAISEQDVVQEALEPETGDQASAPANEVGPTPEGEAEVTPVAQSSSPVPTPEATFVSPVSTPAAASEPPTATATPGPTVLADPPTPSPTPPPTIELPPDCENRARFGRDVTVEDGTQFAPAEQFEKTWLLENAGECPWGPGYTVRLIEGDRMGIETTVPLVEVIQPNGNGEITVPMIAPAAAGTYRGDWQLYDLNGQAFGPEFYLEIEVVAPDATALAESDLTTLYDFLANAGEAIWTSGEVTYPLQESGINETMDLPAPRGLIVRGPAQLRGNVASQSEVLLTYPHQELGFIEGRYAVDQPLQPTDALAATVGFIKESILSDDGVTFEVVFTAGDGSEQVILSRLVQYQDSPATEIQPLVGLQPGQTGTFTLRVRGGDSPRQDWAVWIDVRLIRP